MVLKKDLGEDKHEVEMKVDAKRGESNHIEKLSHSLQWTVKHQYGKWLFKITPNDASYENDFLKKDANSQIGAKVKLVSTPAKSLFDGAIRLRYGLPSITPQLGLYFSALF